MLLVCRCIGLYAKLEYVCHLIYSFTIRESWHTMDFVYKMDNVSTVHLIRLACLHYIIYPIYFSLFIAFSFSSLSLRYIYIYKTSTILIYFSCQQRTVILIKGSNNTPDFKTAMGVHTNRYAGGECQWFIALYFHAFLLCFQSS